LRGKLATYMAMPAAEVVATWGPRPWRRLINRHIGQGPLRAAAPTIGPLIEAIGMTIPFIRLIKIRICSAWNARLFID